MGADAERGLLPFASGGSRGLWRKFDALLASFLSVSDNRGNKTTKRTPDGAVTTKSAKLRWALFAALGVMLISHPSRPGPATRSLSRILRLVRAIIARRRPRPSRARACSQRRGGGDVARGEAAFIDVLPQRPPQEPARRCRLARQAAVRHPRQRVAPRHRLWRARARHARSFRRGLDKALAGGRRRSCSTASRIAGCRGTQPGGAALGYKNVDSYPEGSDGWAAAGLPLEKRTPEPRP